VFCLDFLPKSYIQCSMLKLKKILQVKKARQLSTIDMENLIHTLQMQQIELELQNTELKIAKEQAEVATEKYAELYDFAPLGYFTLSKDDKIIELNYCGSQMLSRERQKLKNTRFSSFVSENSGPLFQLFLDRVFDGKTSETCELTLSVDDQIFDVFVTGYTAENSDQCLIIVQDVTQRKFAENALIKSEEKLRSLIQYSSDPIFGFNRDETYMFVNEAFARPLGKVPSEIIGKTPYAIFPYEEAERRLSLVRKVFMIGQKGEIEVKVDTPSGENQYYLTTADPVKDAQNQVVYVNCVSKNITQLKRVDQALKESEAQIAAFLAAMPDMIFILNSKGVFIDYHGPISTELYVQPEDFIGKEMCDVLPFDVIPQFKMAFENAILTKEVQLCEYSMLLPNGLNYYESKMVAFDDDKILTIVRNVSLYKEAVELIEMKNSDLQKLNAEKDKFFSIIAHDLRGPFSGFLGLTESMSKKLPNMTLTEVQDITSLMRNSAAHLFRLLGNLLEWSSMQRGLSTFDPKFFLLSQKISDIRNLSVDAAKRKEIVISSQVPDDLVVFADENMFESIVRNLLSNAIKFTPVGGLITISARRNGVESVEVSVSDTGIGMNRYLIDHIFNQDIPSNRKGTEGEYSTGLGLIICKDFIGKHGGNLLVDSEEGKGSTFRITLPLPETL
jgi:PAS domain S-box-containing protein